MNGPGAPGDTTAGLTPAGAVLSSTGARSSRRGFTAFAFRSYRCFAVGTFVSNIGTWMQRLAQDWLILELTGSGSALGITTGLQFVPILLLSPFAGALADRMSKHRMIVVIQVCLAVVAGLLGVLAVTGAVLVWHVYVLSFLFGAATAFDVPVRQAFVNELVDREAIPSAVGLNGASLNLARMLGPAIGGALIAATGSGVPATGLVILLNAASYVAVLVSLRFIGPRPAAQATSALQPRQIRAALSYIREDRDLLLVLAVAGWVGMFAMNFQLTTALMATREFGRGAGQYGLLASALAFGSVTGALVAARRERPRLRVIILSAVGLGMMEVVLGVTPTYATYAAGLPICGVLSMTTIMSMSTFVQLHTTEQMRGRVVAIYLMMLMGGTPVGAPALGWVADRFGARWTLLCGGSLAAAGVAVITALLEGDRVRSACRRGSRGGNGEMPVAASRSAS